MTSSKGSILVTGANGGLGSSIVRQITSTPEYLTHHGLYTVTSKTTASSLQHALHSSGAPRSYSHDIVSLDLTDLARVREVAAALNARITAGEIPPIRALVLCAGWQEFTTQSWVGETFDKTFAANYLGHWLFTLLLLQSMDREQGRIIVVGSLAHDPSAKQNLHGQFNDSKWKTIFPDGTEAVAKGLWSTTHDDPSWCGGFRRYGAAKLCLLMMIGELQRRLNADPVLSNLSILGVDPGTMPSGIVRRGPWAIRMVLFKVIIPLFALVAVWVAPNGPLRTTKKSASDIVAAAFDTGPGLGERPKGIYMNGSSPGSMSAEAVDQQKQARLWSDTVQYVQLQKDETMLSNWK